MNRNLAPSEHGMRKGIHILTAVLLITVVGAALRQEWHEMLLITALSVMYAGIYMMGQPKKQLHAQLWVLALTVLWMVMLPISAPSIYMLFPLYFLYLQVMPDYRGLMAVVGATLISILSQWQHLTPGGVLGPLSSALVTVGIHYAFRALLTVNQERQELIDELLSTRHQLAESERAAGVAMERQRIAHEIHDTLAQGLSSIQMLLHVSENDIEKGNKQAALEHIQLARHTAADNLQEARAMIAALQPAALSKTSLEGALQRVAGGIVGTQVHIAVDGDERQLPMRTEAALLRIAQGAMGNVAKHAQAKNCYVTLSYSDDEVRIDVVDDGVGFDPATVAARPAGLGHIGLSAMQQRAAEQDGEVTVESTPGRGTAVSIALPVNTLESQPDTRDERVGLE